MGFKLIAQLAASYLHSWRGGREFRVTATTSTEIRTIADSAYANASKTNSFKERILRLSKVVKEIGRSWIGSDLGYHSCSYYNALRPKL
jgi:hypothetical protein